VLAGKVCGSVSSGGGVKTFRQLVGAVLKPVSGAKVVEQAKQADLSDEQKANLNARLTLAFDRMTYDPMVSAWEALQDALRAEVANERQ
jgi:Tfp pilus assembly protein PilF